MSRNGSSSLFRGYHIAILLSMVLHGFFVLLLWSWWEPTTPPLNQPPRTDQASIQPVVTTEQASAKNPGKLQNTELEIDVPLDQIQSSVQSQIEQVAPFSDSQKLKTLERKLDQLSQVAKPDSVEQVANAVAASMGIDPSQYGDKPSTVQGNFDHSTAQIKTIIRSADKSGEWKYVATMVDAQGHQLQTPLTESEGSSAYQAFQTMKEYPIAESLYQKIIMPMLQKMIESESDR